jgi:predicted RNase H-like HicB family nuclease
MGATISIPKPAFVVGSAVATIITLGSAQPMETPLPESIPIVLGQEDDGRWRADIESMPGVMAYGPTREAAVAAVRALALRVAADCIDHGEDVPPHFEKVFFVA